MDAPEVALVAGGGTTALSLKVTNGMISHVGIQPAKEPVGWSRLYMHLWKQALETGLREDNAVEQWVLDALAALSAYDSRIHPQNISYANAVMILTRAGVIAQGKALPFDPLLKESHDDNWYFRQSPDKYSKRFVLPEQLAVLPGGFTGWWMRLEDAVPADLGIDPILGGAAPMAKPEATASVPAREYQDRDPGLYRSDWSRLSFEDAYQTHFGTVREMIAAFSKRLRSPIKLEAGEKIIVGEDDRMFSKLRAMKKDTTPHFGFDVGSRISMDGKTVSSRCLSPVTTFCDGGVLRREDGMLIHKICLVLGDYRLVLRIWYQHVTPAVTDKWAEYDDKTSLGALEGYEGGCNGYDLSIPSVEVPCSGYAPFGEPRRKGRHVHLEFYGFLAPLTIGELYKKYVESLTGPKLDLDQASKKMIEALVALHDQMLSGIVGT